MNSRVYFIIVCYESDPELLIENVNRLALECCGGVVVDNSEGKKNEALENAVNKAGENFILINNEVNRGIAVAINQGVEKALASDADFFLLMDDDSTFENDALTNMLQAYKDLLSAGERVAAVGPCFVDKVTGKTGVYPVFRGIRTERHHCSSIGGERFRSEYLMTSGSLISRVAIETVGLMREELFIDLVDTEWCLRARSLGWCCYVVCDAKMDHRFGSRTLPLIKVSYRPPVRHYYIYRNSIRVLGLAHIPLAWKFLQLAYLLKLFFLLLLLPADRFSQIKYLLKGIVHGFLGKMDPIEGS
ncbi:MAG: rhamnosyltransferase [Planctomycetota bacterium]|jgi:rhamnosyltransferase